MARIEINLNRVKSEIDPKIFGHFTEHAFKNIYGGVYDPESELADEDGFRKDVLEALRQVKVPLLRYPGGNFVSNYHWEDGIGPKEHRKRVFEYAWLTEESNQFGTADFILLCRKVGAEPLLCINMGTGTVEEAMHWVEYCNGTGNTYYANLRRSHGYEEPFHVKYWGLGNEMYGMWQMNHQSAADYAKAALEYAKAIKWIDPSVKLIACGFEQDSDWNYTVMKVIGQMVDYISAHHYSIGWGPFENRYMDTLYIPEYMKRLTDLTLSAANAGMNDISKVKVAWDEWNLFGWAVDGVDDNSTYTLHDALISALIMNMFIRNSDKIGMANYSTFVNINGAIQTLENGLVKRPQYHVFDLLGNHTGTEAYEVVVSGEKLEVNVTKSPDLGRPDLGLNLIAKKENRQEKVLIDTIDCAVSGDEEGNVYISLVNKDPEKEIETEICITGESGMQITEAYTIYHDDLNAANTQENPDNVTLKKLECPKMDDRRMFVTLKKHSVNLIQGRVLSD